MMRRQVPPSSSAWSRLPRSPPYSIALSSGDFSTGSATLPRTRRRLLVVRPCTGRPRPSRCDRAGHFGWPSCSWCLRHCLCLGSFLQGAEHGAGGLGSRSHLRVPRAFAPGSLASRAACGASAPGETVMLDDVTLISKRYLLTGRPDRIVKHGGLFIPEEWKSSKKVQPWDLA